MESVMQVVTPSAEIAPKAAPKVNLPHPWAGKPCFYWRVTNQATGELSPLPAMLIEPTRGTDGWALNFWRMGAMQGRAGIKRSDTPRAGYFTLPEPEPTADDIVAAFAEDAPRRGRKPRAGE